MKTVIISVIATLAVVALLAAATRITVNQIIGSQIPGQVITTVAPGVSGWSTAPVVPSFADAEVPSGTVNGTNGVFTLAFAPTGTSLALYRNGILQQAGTSADYVLTGSTVTFNSGNFPQQGDVLVASYRH